MQTLIRLLILKFLQEYKIDNPDIAKLIETSEYEFAIERVIEECMLNIDEFINENYADTELESD